jgi:peptide methionine sulfoxide reductase MsrB
LLRLVVDHDVFFEFVPVENLDSPHPARHTLADILPGVNYAVVLTTCAGLWSYVLGDTVIFESRRPALLRFSGRTKYFLSAFGEHLISEEVERAVTAAATATGCAVIDFHVGPVFPEEAKTVGRHRYLVEFASTPPDPIRFANEIDVVLSRLNEDYQAHRQGDLTMRAPEVVPVRREGFAEWMRSRGKLGGQHKVPRMDNSGQITAQLARFFAAN